MSRFSGPSLKRLKTCHADLVRLFEAVAAKQDCIVICGHRSEAEQQKAIDEKRSKLKWPLSKHNRYPSLAIDAGPWPLDWSDTAAFLAFSKVVMETAKELQIKLRWGGDWNRNGTHKDERFLDLVHFELDGY